MRAYLAIFAVVFITNAHRCAAKGCNIVSNADSIDWDRLSGSGKWYQALNSNNAEETIGSCILIRVVKQNASGSDISYDLTKPSNVGHTITVYNSLLPSKPHRKARSSLDAPDTILSTLKVDDVEEGKLKVDIHNFGVYPEHFTTDYKTYFIGKMCWNDEVYIWAYLRSQYHDNMALVNLFHKIQSDPDATPVTFAGCEEEQDFAIGGK